VLSIYQTKDNRWRDFFNPLPSSPYGLRRDKGGVSLRPVGPTASPSRRLLRVGDRREGRRKGFFCGSGFQPRSYDFNDLNDLNDHDL
jgi:hypothetical protein